jgi:prolyl 4-hydroxylase
MLLFTFDKLTAPQQQGSSLSYSCHDDLTWAVATREIPERPGSRRKEYEAFMQSCEKHAATAGQCQLQDNWRMQMNMYQPRSMYNFSDIGYTKGRVPHQIFTLISDFWNNNKHEQVLEWDNVTTDIYQNKIDVPTSMVSVSNSSLIGGGPSLAEEISKSFRFLIQEWTGMRQAATSIYGVRVYKNNSILTPHVDRLPLVSSVIINVAQDVDEDWPLEVYAHDGKAHNITMAPGDMLFYESVFT